MFIIKIPINLDKQSKICYTVFTKYERYKNMNKLNTMFLNEYNKADELCRGKFGSDDGVAKYISEMEGASDNKAKIANWDEDYHTLGKCMHIYNVINIQQNMRRKSQ